MLLLLWCNDTVNAQNQRKFDIRGKIVNLTRAASATEMNGLLGSVLVEGGTANSAGGYAKAVVKVTKATGIYLQTDDDKRNLLEFDALKLNQSVEVRFAPGPALMTFPIQVAAAEIIILPNSPDSSPNGENPSSNNGASDANSEIENVRRQINAMNALWVEAWAKGDAAMILSTFTADGKELVAGGKVYKGGKQILAFVREAMAKRGGRAKLTVTTTDVWLDGNTAFETGKAIYEFTVEGETKTLERRYFTVWKRLSKVGAWKIYSNVGIAKQ